jgi:hypothetical protein
MEALLLLASGMAVNLANAPAMVSTTGAHVHLQERAPASAPRNSSRERREGPPLRLGRGCSDYVKAGAEPQFTGYEGLSVLVVFDKPQTRPEKAAAVPPA